MSSTTTGPVSNDTGDGGKTDASTAVPDSTGAGHDDEHAGIYFVLQAFIHNRGFSKLPELALLAFS